MTLNLVIAYLAGALSFAVVIWFLAAAKNTAARETHYVKMKNGTTMTVKEYGCGKPQGIIVSPYWEKLEIVEGFSYKPPIRHIEERMMRSEEGE